VIYAEFFVPGAKAEEAFKSCYEELGEQVQHHFMIWECKSTNTGALFFLYRPNDAAWFAMKYA